MIRNERLSTKNYLKTKALISKLDCIIGRPHTRTPITTSPTVYEHVHDYRFGIAICVSGLSDRQTPRVMVNFTRPRPTLV